ncbi:MAG TPA: hypothetical protein DHV86_01355, partial [Methylophilaceae bacterium]|nr:hypothetical protein [Methylophilaceae bacterium]
MIAKKILLIFAVLATSASSLLFDIKAQENYENLDRIVAIVEKDIITKKEFDLEVIQIIQQYKKMNVPTPSQESLDKIVIDKIIEKKLVQQYAELKGIKIGAEYLDQTINNIAENNNLTTQELQKSIESEGMSFSYFQEKIKYQIIFEQLKEREIISRINISEYEIEAFIDRNKKRNPSQYHLGHIQLKTTSHQGENKEDKLKIDKIINLLKVEPFEEVAKIYSEGSLATDGGDMGWKKIDELPEIFANAIITMRVGEISKPLYTGNGVHLLKLKSAKDGGLQQNKILSEQYNINQILLKTNEITSENDIIKKLENIKNQISAGLSFSDAARQYSEDASSSNGGNLGWVDKSSMLPEYRRAVELTKLNQVGGPYKSELGWVRLFLTEQRDQDITQEKIRTSAKIQLQKNKAEVKIVDWLQALRDQSR